jgi:hypothetical protein
MNIGEQIRQIRIWRALIARNEGRKCTCAWCQRACEELDLLEQELLDYIIRSPASRDLDKASRASPR